MICGMLGVVYGEVWSSLFVFDNVERCGMPIYGVPMLLFLLGYGMGMVLANFQMYSMMLVLRASVCR